MFIFKRMIVAVAMGITWGGEDKSGNGRGSDTFCRCNQEAIAVAQVRCDGKLDQRERDEKWTDFGSVLKVDSMRRGKEGNFWVWLQNAQIYLSVQRED